MRKRDDDTLVYSSDPRTPVASTAAIAIATARNVGGGRGADAGARDRQRSAPSRPDGIVRIWLERKGRNGKPVSIIRDLSMSEDALAELAGRLKRLCGTGGSAKDGEIIIQGDHRTRIAEELQREGLRVKLAGG